MGQIPSQIQMCGCVCPCTTPLCPRLLISIPCIYEFTHTPICGNKQPYQTHQEAPRPAPFHMNKNNENRPSPLISLTHTHTPKPLSSKAQCHCVLTSSINDLMIRDGTWESVFNIFITTLCFLNALY